MTSLHISELAERSGVPRSTLRYYERIGLVQPAGRSDNGYRVYDEDAVDRLAFIGRAKRLGMTLEEAAGVLDAWAAGECEPVHEQLRAFVAARLAELRGHIADDAAFERQLQRILAGLSQTTPVPGACGSGCGCDADPLDVTDRVPASCSLSPNELTVRLGEWRRLLQRATGISRDRDASVATFEPSPALAGELAALCAAEVECCSAFTFTLEVTSSALTMTVVGGDLLGAIDGTCRSTT